MHAGEQVPQSRALRLRQPLDFNVLSEHALAIAIGIGAARKAGVAMPIVEQEVGYYIDGETGVDQLDEHFPIFPRGIAVGRETADGSQSIGAKQSIAVAIDVAQAAKDSRSPGWLESIKELLRCQISALFKCQKVRGQCRQFRVVF